MEVLWDGDGDGVPPRCEKTENIISRRMYAVGNKTFTISDHVLGIRDIQRCLSVFPREGIGIRYPDQVGMKGEEGWKVP